MASENTPFELNDLNDPELEALAVALRENRPSPQADFAEKLDTAVADHFPPEWSDGVTSKPTAGFFSGMTDRFHFGGFRQLLPVAAGFAGIVLVVVVIGVGTTNDSGPDNSPTFSTSGDSSSGGPTAISKGTAEATSEEAALVPNSGPAQGRASGAVSPDQAAPVSPGAVAAGTDQRKVAHETDITLGTDPDSVQDVSNDIVGVVDEHNGIVLDSSVQDGPAGEAGAIFSLMIPTAQLESAVSDLSGLADLKARNQETEDITAPTLTVEDSLRDSRARVDSLVKELSESTSDEDRARIEAELASERRQAARLNTRLNKLERRANLTPVSVTVETGGDTSSDSDDSTWGVSDAFDDAGNMLGISAGVALIALAIAVPIGLMVLIALALNRAWVRHSRRRALDEN